MEKKAGVAWNSDAGQRGQRMLEMRISEASRRSPKRHRKLIMSQLTVKAGVFLALSFRHTSSMATSLSSIMASASFARQPRFFLPASSIASEQPPRATLIRM